VSSDEIAGIETFIAANEGTVVQPPMADLRTRLQADGVLQDPFPALVREMRNPDPAKWYFSARLFLNEHGNPEWSIFTRWIRDSGKRPRIELRKKAERRLLHP
jgi:hypothetical protein